MSIECMQTSSNNKILKNSSSTKCGEMFLDSKKENITFVCAVCLRTFKRISSFGEHLHKCFTPLKEFDKPTVKVKEKEESQTKPDHVVEVAEELDLEIIEENSPANDNDVIDLEDTNTQDTSEDESMQTEPTIETEKEYLTKDKPANDIPVEKTQNVATTTLCCFSCGTLVLTRKALRNHYLLEHPDMIEKNSIVDCGGLKKIEFVPKIPSEMSCKFCLKTFNEPKTFHSHMQFDHIDKIYSCDRCSARFKHAYSRDYHVDAHNGEKRFKCPHCPAMFTHPSNRATHAKFHLSENRKKYACRFCEKKFNRNGDLKIHERTHTNERPFQCEECGESFIARIKLTQHLRKHKNIKNYKCTLCDKAFFRSCMLKDHMTSHTTERPFSCDICEKTFKLKKHLRTHKMLHSDTKRYDCQLCGKMFAQHIGLYTHMKSHKMAE